MNIRAITLLIYSNQYFYYILVDDKAKILPFNKTEFCLE